MMDPKQDAAGHLSCTFCGKRQREVLKLIVGSDAVICDECVALCTDIIAETTARDPKPQASRSGSPACGFCKKSVDEVSMLIAGPSGQYICDECVRLCNDILREEKGRRL